MKYFLLFMVLILFLNKASLSKSRELFEWKLFKTKYIKNYDLKEEQSRYEIFKKNLQLIENHNKDFEQRKVTWKMSLNQFADLTKEEFKDYALCQIANRTFDKKIKTFKYNSNITLPEKVDWRDKDAVGPVKNQGNCGSCWAFSAVGSIESQVRIHYGNKAFFSEQALVDCSNWNHGCKGGFTEYAFAYVARWGLPTEDDYPYRGYTQTCHWPYEVAIKTQTYQYVHSDDRSLAGGVNEIGPISVAIDASNFQFYVSGIFQDTDCSKSYLNHAVVVVGYGEENGTKFWIVRNSWGEYWGESGYIRMSREINNMCGILNYPSYPVIYL